MKYLRFKTLLIFITCLTLTLTSFAYENTASSNQEEYSIIEIKAENLPELNIARSGHEALYVNGTMTVFGGHTEGFVPTQTAEYYKDGSWHTLQLVYPHDQGVALPLRSGKVFLAGGHREPLGIGQLFSAELYNPETNTSEGFGCMSIKRAFENALELADGKIVISGNWFEKDGIGMFEDVYSPECTNAIAVKDVSYGRAKPYILRISEDDAIIFSSLSNYYKPVDYSVVDRLKGDSYKEPFLNTWTPIRTIEVRRSLNQFIGDEADGRYEWLLPVENDKTKQVAIARVKGITDKTNPSELPEFSLFPLAQPLPDSIGGKKIIYSSLMCDRDRKMTYLIGNNDEPRTIVVAFPYNTLEPAPLTIYMTDQKQPIIAQSNSPMITREGDLVFAGGRLINNFDVSKAVRRLPIGKFYSVVNDSSSSNANGTNNNSSRNNDKSGGKSGFDKDNVKDNSSVSESKPWWGITLGGLAFCIVVGILLWRYRKSHSTVNPFDLPLPLTSGDDDDENQEDKNHKRYTSVPTDTDDSSGLESEPVSGSDGEFESESDSDSAIESDIPMDKNLPRDEILVDLFKRIERLMKEEEVYLNPNLRASDVAEKVNSNTAYVSAAINSNCRCSFTQYLAGYRIAYAKKLMLEEPESKISNISIQSGFTTDSTFFRAFRALTGMTPKEWLAANGKKPNAQN